MDDSRKSCSCRPALWDRLHRRLFFLLDPAASGRTLVQPTLGAFLRPGFAALVRAFDLTAEGAQADILFGAVEAAASGRALVHPALGALLGAGFAAQIRALDLSALATQKTRSGYLGRRLLLLAALVATPDQQRRGYGRRQFQYVAS